MSENIKVNVGTIGTIDDDQIKEISNRKLREYILNKPRSAKSSIKAWSAKAPPPPRFSR